MVIEKSKQWFLPGNVGKVGTDPKGQEDFPGGPVVGSLPTNAGDAGWIPGQGRFHMTCSSWAHVPHFQAGTAEPRSCNHRSPKAPELHNRRKPLHSNKEPTPQPSPSAAKIKKRRGSKDSSELLKIFFDLDGGFTGMYIHKN